MSRLEAAPKPYRVGDVVLRGLGLGPVGARLRLDVIVPFGRHPRPTRRRGVYRDGGRNPSLEAVPGHAKPVKGLVQAKRGRFVSLKVNELLIKKRTIC